MSKQILIWGGAAIAVIIVGFLVFKMTMSAGTPANNTAAAANTTASTTPQVQAQEVSVGTGAEATPGTQVSVLYVGQLQDGTVFDSSAMHNNQPYTFVLGGSDANSPIPGFQIGVNGMKVGGERVLSIPPELGYGTQEVKDASGKVVIPANSTIVFNVKLVNVATAPAANTTKK